MVYKISQKNRIAGVWSEKAKMTQTASHLETEWTPQMTRSFFFSSFLAVFLFPYGILSLFNEVETSHKGPYKHVLLDFKSDLKVPLSYSLWVKWPF